MDQPWQDDRRRSAAMDAQHRHNEEMAESDRTETKKGGGFGYLVFMVTVIFFKPFAEYCIDLYNTLAGYAHSLAALFGL
ncbi:MULTISPECIES: hypothetical protein [unclassified Shinella]|uniref:hypothetical protein n=1 Tax=unclassified Shinella TaxID=2643062 RepID=UPI00225CFB5E|nr:hypothetical protein [Shinella sp. YE25]MDC7259819.1 hypothetical protein [Shinella sp. YE25]CAI0334000.1 conserved hypothetical protein [Rhizobiaceae bacterium]CAK7261646.1 conserved protein of unknown function [Shinella sp. WSC3-e]